MEPNMHAVFTVGIAIGGVLASVGAAFVSGAVAGVTIGVGFAAVALLIQGREDIIEILESRRGSGEDA